MRDIKGRLTATVDKMFFTHLLGIGGFAFITSSLIGCQMASHNNEPSIPIDQFSSVQNIKDYLNIHVASTGFNGQPYCAYEVLDAQPEGEYINVYSWVVCQEYYYLEGQQLQQGTGSALPVALILQRNDTGFEVVNHSVPRDGAFYTEDMSAIFSKRFRAIIQSETTNARNERVNRLQDKILNDAGDS